MINNKIYINKPNISQNRWYSIGNDTEAMNVPGGCIIKSILIKSKQIINYHRGNVFNEDIPAGISTLFLPDISVVKWYSLETFMDEQSFRLGIVATPNFELEKTINTFNEPQKFFMADEDTPQELEKPSDEFIKKIIENKTKIYRWE